MQPSAELQMPATLQPLKALRALTIVARNPEDTATGARMVQQALPVLAGQVHTRLRAVGSEVRTRAFLKGGMHRDQRSGATPAFRFHHTQT
jgi:hypothetical protein